MSHASDTVRIEFKKEDDIRDAGLTTPENIIRYDDIVYGAEYDRRCHPYHRQLSPPLLYDQHRRFPETSGFDYGCKAVGEGYTFYITILWR